MLVLEHIPFLSTVSSLQKQPLVQGNCSLHPLTPVMSLQDKFQLQSRYTVPIGQAKSKKDSINLLACCIFNNN